MTYSSDSKSRQRRSALGGPLLTYLCISLAFAAEPALTGVSLVHAEPSAHVQRPLIAPDGRTLAWETNDHLARVVQTWWQPAGLPASVYAPEQGAPSALLQGFASSQAPQRLAHELALGLGAPPRRALSVSSDARDYDVVVDGLGRLSPTPEVDGGPAWSPDGKLLVFTSGRTGQGDLYLWDASSPAKPPERLTTQAEATELYAAFSPDGDHLAYSGRSAKGTQVYLLSLKTRQARALTDGPGERILPAFSPDGAHIAFRQATPGQAHQSLVVVPTQGGTPKVLATLAVAGLSPPAWVNDTHLLYVMDDDGAFDPLRLVSLSGQSQQVQSPLIGHSELTVKNGLVLVTAQGEEKDWARDFRKLYRARLQL